MIFFLNPITMNDIVKNINQLNLQKVQDLLKYILNILKCP